MHWNSSPHPISDIKDWVHYNRLELQPDFQRRPVWSAAARIMLIDTILRGIPMPKILVVSSMRDDKTYRVVIDGQQRLRAIIDFMKDGFSLDNPYLGKEKGKKFSELDEETRKIFLRYRIDFNEATDISEKEVREVFSRVNKYTVQLNKQELRRADFPGKFLTVSEELAKDSYFNNIRIFTPANVRRCTDVEYVSELLSAMIGGIQNKKEKLDNFYMKYADWDKEEQDKTVTRFKQTIKELKVIFGRESSKHISKTRFRQKSDFYTLFLAIDGFVKKGNSIKEKDISYLQKDLMILQENIAPESLFSICSEYAIKCVSQANSLSSRRWRHGFIKSILSGSYVRERDIDDKRIFYKICEGLYGPDVYGYCPAPVIECDVCNKEITGDYLNECLIAWPLSDTTYQISNLCWIHRSCKTSPDWLILERVDYD